jgi:hypothetical protein
MGKTLGYGEITVANMTEPFTVMLTNEAQQFATDSNRKVTSAQSYYTDIIVIRGSQERTDYTIGNITSGSGITVSKNSKRVTFSVSAGTTIGADAGVIEIPITLDGQTVKKQFSWSCGKQGPQGVKGQDGQTPHVHIAYANITFLCSENYRFTLTESTLVRFGKNDKWVYKTLEVGTYTANSTTFGSDPLVGTVKQVDKIIDFSIVDSTNKTHMGQYADFIESNSSDPSKYTWVLTKGATGDKGIDGEKFSWNLLQDSSFPVGTKKWNLASGFSVDTENKYNGYNSIKIANQSSVRLDVPPIYFADYNIGEDLYLTFWVMCPDVSKITTNNVDTWIGFRQGHDYKPVASINKQITKADFEAAGNGNWFKVSISGNCTDETATTCTFMLQTNNSPAVFYVACPMLSRNNVEVPYAPHPEDLEGRGVSETVQYYLATSQASGVTSSTSGWSIDITTQKLTTDKKYLWNCYQTKYSDGTSEPISTPKVIGVYGDKGQKGDNAKNLSITPSSQYFKSTDGGKTFAPNTITIKPTIQGEISFGKWQYSIDGGVSFADVVSGQKGLTISNNVLSVSKDSSLYSDAVTMVTFRAVANDSSFYDTCSIAKIYDVSDIGDGRNLLTGVSSYTKDTPFEKTDSRADGWIVYQDIITSIELEAGKKYVLQAKTDGNWAANHDTSGQDPSKKLVTLWLCSDKTNDFFDMRKGYVIFTPTVTAKYKLRVNQYSNGTDAYTIHLWDIKLEKGSSPTGWTPAPEDVQTAILSTKSEISDVSLKVDNNKQAIEQRVEKTTYERELTLVKGDISKANEGLNKWRYEIYPKSLFASEYQGKSTMDVFAKNTNLTPSQSVLINDTDLSIAWNYDNNYIGYALTFVKFSAAKSVAITFAHDDGAHIYLNGKLIGGSDAYNRTGESLTLGFVKGWNCIEVVVNEGASTEGFKLGTTISALSECQLMNCYYGTPVARQSHITNQLVENTINLEGVSGKVQKVMTTVGNSGNIDEFVNNYSTWKTSVDKIETRVGQTYVTKSDFDGLEIGGRNLILNSAFKNGRKEWSDWGNPTTREIVSSNGKMWAHIVGNKQNYQGFNQWTPAGSIKEGDHITFSARIKGSAANQKFSVGIHWINSGNIIISQDWHVFTVDTTENIYTWTIDAKGSGCNKLNLMVGVSDTSASYNVYFTEIMVEKGNKATDWTPAPEDDEINGQNLVSNLPSNWERGTFQDGKTNVGCDYDTNKAFMTTRIRVKELVPVSGTITISNAYSNQSKKPVQLFITAFDVNKKWLGAGYVGTDWSDFPKIVDVKDAKYIAVIVKYKDDSAITPSDISQICLKIERGTSATPFTLAPEDVNGKIVNVETIANQTAKKFEWIVKGGDKSSSMVLTDDFLNIVANKINLKGKVTFESLSSDAKSEIGKVAQSKVDGLEVGGRNLARGTSNEYSTPYTYFNGSANTCFDIGRVYLDDLKAGDRITVHMYIKYDNLVAASGKTIQIWLQGSGNVTLWNGGSFPSTLRPTFSGSGVYELLYSAVLDKYHVQNEYWNCGIRTDYIQSGSVQVKSFKVEKGNKATDWTPAPEDYLPQVDLVSNWTTNTTWIDGGKIYTGSITADKIATDAIRSKNYVANSTGSFLNLKDGSFDSKYLKWDASGNITAKGGTIGKYKITDQWLITGSGSTCTGIGGNQAFWAGAESSDSAPFRVGYDGSLVSIKGKIGKFNLANALYVKNNEMFTIGSNSAKKIFGQNNDGDIYLGEDGISTSAWNTGETYIGDSGTIKADITSSNGICLTGGMIKAYYSSYCKDYPNADNTCVGTLIGAGSIVFTSYNEDGVVNSIGTLIKSNEITTERFVASSITVKNGGLIETAGTVYGGREIQCGGDQVRIISGNIGCMLRNDSADFYILRTNSGDPYGGWTNDRPFRINWASNDITCGHNLTANDLIANSWLYCSEVHSSGAVVIGSDSESFYWAHGFQIARGTSWGGVCIGDDSQQLRLYGSSIWASHGISTSDENLKENFTTLDQYEDFYMNLNPIGFNYIGDYDGKKTHFGFGAHKTEDVLESEGYDADEFAVVTHRPLVQEDLEKRFGKDVEVDIETEYGVSYTEFIALNTHMIQKTRKELETLKQEKADLESRLAELEEKFAKLNL